MILVVGQDFPNFLETSGDAVAVRSCVDRRTHEDDTGGVECPTHGRVGHAE